MKLPVITLWQPWAQWVMLGWKTIETRTHSRFASLEGKRIGIHVGQRWDSEAFTTAAPYLSTQRLLETRRNEEAWRKLAGLIVATADVQDHRLLLPYDSKAALIECYTTRYGLVLENLRTTAIKAQGKQGLWYFDLETK